MNLGMNFLIPQENGAIHNEVPWIPVTPEKPVTLENRVIFPGDPLIPVTPETPVMQQNRVIYNWDAWIPGTPEMPVIRQPSAPITGEMQRGLKKCVNMHQQFGLQGQVSAEKPVVEGTYPIPGEVRGDMIERTSWSELLEFCSGVLQETPTNDALQDLHPDGLLGHIEHNKPNVGTAWDNGYVNQSAGSHMQNFIVDVNGTRRRSVCATGKLPLISLHPAVGNEWARNQFDGSVLLQQKQALSADQGIISSGTQKLPNELFPVPYKPLYDLNSPPEPESTVVSSTVKCFQFAPVTPDQGKRLINNQLYDVQNISRNESLRQDQDKQELIFTNSQAENHFDELLHNVVTSPSAFNSVSPKGINVYEDRDHRGIDMNETPQQRPPKRKKHRPKVVVEGKPKKTPKPTTSKAKVLDENPSGKRKYVRRKGLEISYSTPGNETIGGEASARTSAKSCRRALNFDLESEIPDKSEDKVIDDQESRQLLSKHFDLNKNSQDSICSTRVNKVLDISLTTEGQQNGRNADILQGKNTRNIIGDNNQKLAEQSLSVSLTASPTTGRDHTLNAIARNLSLQTATSCQHNDHSGYNQGHQHLNGEGIGQMLLQTNSSLTKLDATQMLMLQSSTQFLKGFAERKETNRSKSDHWHISQMMNPKFVDLSHSQFLHHDISRNVEQNEDSSKTEIVTDETMKHKVSCCGPSCAASIQYCSKQSESRGFNNAPKSSSSCFYGMLPNYNLEMQNKIMKQNIGGNGISSDQGTNTTTAGNASQELRSSSAIEHLRHLLARKNHHQNAKIQTLHVTTGKIECLPSPSPRLSSTTQGNGIKACPADLLTKMQTVIPMSSIQTFSKEKLYPNKSTKEIVSQKSSMKAKGLKERRNCAATIDEITYRLKGLHISKSRKKVVAKEQNAIVPYKGDDKVVVFEGFHPIKIRRPRPKVDLDAETKRLWNLLMGKDGAENMETMDSGKEKCWEEQRKLVRGRIDSFIARMHLVQGDRRFSQWKGSVVDSVIGVFLTQNVSDHLSSSAFMSLAAKFPLPSTNSKTTCCEPISSTEEPGAQIIDPDGTIAYHGRNISQPFYKQNSMTLSESSERQSLNIISETGVHYASENNSGTEEEVVSSQNSSDSFPRSTKYMRSSSDSEVEDQIRVCSSMNCISENTPKSERVYMYQQYQCPIMTDQLIDKSPMPRFQQHENPARIRLQGSNNESNLHAYPVNSDVLRMPGSLSPFSVSSNKTSESGVNGSYRSGYSEHKSVPIFLPTCTDISKTGGAAHSRQEAGGITESTSCSFTQETRMPVSHAIRMGQPRCLHQPKDNSQPEFQFVSSQKSTDSDLVRISKSFHQTEKSVIEAKRLDNTDATIQNGNICFSSETLSTTETNIPNARKRKQNVDKRESFDWDSLRKKVLKKLGKKERSQDNMDSLDYEALGRADVKTISDTILERGMNNMLAERIKDFLDRLVREHGSVDLEWLRDVSADEAKDFLLSIRGLGLKSVECVRLLTLHQIAFPVDTNVGRIAVRLGWVPIQPLPESLQLHLLELYPVLESIQKYLWPRLCKLDQRTLYELHYQLITFGKVFCTKKKPNCNACPMRAECRHFASAFASARLALPGPEERSMFNSTTPMGSYDIPSVIVKPIPLPPAKTNMGFESHYSRSNSHAGSEERSMVNSTTPMASYGIPSAIVNPIPLLHAEIKSHYSMSNWEPIIEEPATPESSPEVSESDIEDLFSEDPDEIPTIQLSFEELKMNVQSIMQEQNIDIEPGDISRALVALDPSAASIPAPKLKNVSRLRTEHQVYEIPDSHPLLKGMERREPDDPSPYLLAIWGPGETADSSQPPPESCSPCTYLNEKNSHTVRGTFLIPCRTAMRGSFPLNGTYFQVNEMFADHETSNNPIDVPRDWLWRLPRRTVYFGTSVTSIFRGLSTEGIQYCFWRGFVCVRGFDRKQRAPRPLRTRLHETATKAAKNKEKNTHTNDRQY